MRRNPGKGFAADHQEALLLEEEQGGHKATCFTMGESRQNMSPHEPDWKEVLKREILKDVKDLIKGWHR